MTNKSDPSAFMPTALRRNRACDACGVPDCPLAFTGYGYVCEGCWPDDVPDFPGSLKRIDSDAAPRAPVDTPGAQAWHAMLDAQRSIAEVRGAVVAIRDEQLAKLPELERQFFSELRTHLAEYDRAKRRG